MASCNTGARIYQRQQKSDRHKQIEQYAPLVKRIALHLKTRLPASVELDDLIQAGMLGLMDALSNYEAGHGAAFETYATIRIRGSMIDEIRHADWTPRSVHHNSRQITQAITVLSNRLGRQPKDTEIAAELDVSIDKYHQMLTDSANSQIVGIEDLGVSEDVITTTEGAKEDKIFSALASVEFKKALARAIADLPEREQQILSLYYDEELNLREIGKVMEISESRCCQIMSQSMARLRSALKEWNT
ncbi:Sigma-F factor [Anaerobiospirillum thomasii]|uniref:RNA polymerase sigma factor FliA n=1 Tax=Anaerobiospirillum thomasii TaxID=179995 RepID=UPI000D93BB0D|nr:RNA polymerase sigma factor FliA [Anaerobiospirillum thomasii]SPT71473.1 Sigma-F factor [Anaerobiospirillum thomasii]